MKNNKNGPIILGGIVSAFNEGYCFKIRCKQDDIKNIKIMTKKFLEENGYSVHLEECYYG